MSIVENYERSVKPYNLLEDIDIINIGEDAVFFERKIPNISPSQYNIITKEETLRIQKSLLECLSFYDKKNTSILDIGCGDGYMISQLNSIGWNSRGIEKHINNTKHSKCKIKTNILNFNKGDILIKDFCKVPSVFLKKYNLFILSRNFNRLGFKGTFEEWINKFPKGSHILISFAHTEYLEDIETLYTRSENFIKKFKYDWERPFLKITDFQNGWYHLIKEK